MAQVQVNGLLCKRGTAFISMFSLNLKNYNPSQPPKPDTQNKNITTIQQILHILTCRHLFWTSRRILVSISTPSNQPLHPSDLLPSSSHVVLNLSKTLAPLHTHSDATHPSFMVTSLIAWFTNTLTSLLISPLTWLALAFLVTLLAPVAWLTCALITFSESNSLIPTSHTSSSQQVEVIGSIPGGRKSIVLSKSQPQMQIQNMALTLSFFLQMSPNFVLPHSQKSWISS